MRRNAMLALLPATALLVLTAGARTAAAQDLRVATPYPSVAVEAGDRVTLALDVFADAPTPVRLEVTDAPRGVGHPAPRRGLRRRRRLRPSRGATGGQAGGDRVARRGRGRLRRRGHRLGRRRDRRAGHRVRRGRGRRRRSGADGGVPDAAGASDTTFSFDLDLDNATPQEHTFALAAAGPEGWQVSASPAGEGTAATVTVAAGETESITVEAVPPPGVTAGTYPVVVRATGGGETVEAELEVEITGTFDVVLTTPDERLSVETAPGRDAAVTLLVSNEGSAPLREVELEAEPPGGWEVAFTPEVVDVVAPGETAEARVAITPAEDAIVGDYRVTVSADAAEAADEVDIRVSVETSRAWGAVGVTLVAIALGGLGWVFRTFGRR